MGQKVSTQEVMEFNHMNIYQKDKLRNANPEKYNALFKASQKEFSTETDQEAASILSDKKGDGGSAETSH